MFLFSLRVFSERSSVIHGRSQVGGFLMGCPGWLCILVATSTNNWVIMCKYGTNACKKSEESNIKGPWAECSVSSAHYECQPLTLILELPGRRCSAWARLLMSSRDAYGSQFPLECLCVSKTYFSTPVYQVIWPPLSSQIKIGH